MQFFGMPTGELSLRRAIHLGARAAACEERIEEPDEDDPEGYGYVWQVRDTLANAINALQDSDSKPDLHATEEYVRLAMRYRQPRTTHYQLLREMLASNPKWWRAQVRQFVESRRALILSGEWAVVVGEPSTTRESFWLLAKRAEAARFGKHATDSRATPATS